MAFRPPTLRQVQAMWHNHALYILEGFVKNMQRHITEIDPDGRSAEVQHMRAMLNNFRIVLRESIDAVYNAAKEEKDAQISGTKKR